MYCFNNDYSEGAHPNILNAMITASLDQNSGYSCDVHTAHAIELMQKEIKREDAEIHILVGGTQTNMITIRAALRSHQAAIAAVTGHINVHETGAIESTGHKVLTCDTKDGKLTPAMIQKVLDHHTDEHMVQPKLVYISNTTEIGTQYTLAELEAISRFCKEHDLYLFLDGARLGAALMSPVNDMTIADIARLTDVFYIGGTKNGALFGEALVITHPELKKDFRFLVKQQGALLAKGFLLGIQYEELFQNDLFYDMADHADKMGLQLRKAFEECGFSFFSDSYSNQQFPILPNTLIASLRENYEFQDQAVIDAEHSAVRFVTSWATKEGAVKEFVADLKKLAGR